MRERQVALLKARRLEREIRSRIAPTELVGIIGKVSSRGIVESLGRPNRFSEVGSVVGLPAAGNRDEMIVISRF